MIDLSLGLCPWANWTGTDAAVKMHTMLDLRGPLPSFVTITRGEQNEMAWLDEIPLEAGSYYVMDRGYLDLRRLQRFTREGAFFVIRERPYLKFYVAESRPVDRSTTLRCDQTIRFNGCDSRRSWPERMRRVGIFDAEHSRRMAFWTNQWMLPAETISELYRQRWQIEIFFPWVKQNLASVVSMALRPTPCGCSSGPRSAPTSPLRSRASNSGSPVCSPRSCKSSP